MLIIRNTPVAFAIWALTSVSALAQSSPTSKVDGTPQIQPAQSTIERKVDRFTGSQIITIKLQTVAGDPRVGRITLTAIYDPQKQGRDESIPRRVEITLTLNSLEPYFGRDERITFLVDGERLRPVPLAARRDHDARQTIIHTGMPLDTLRQIARGRSVEVKLGDLEFALTEAAVKTLAEFARAIDGR